MSVRKKVTLALVLVGFSIFASLIWYKIKNSMEFVSSYSVESENAEYKLLIASQGSEYKTKVVKGIIDAAQKRQIDVQVMDVSALSDVNIDDWSVVVILHTWESWRPQQDAMLFIQRNPDLSNTIVLTTSGEGNLKMEGVDAITSASAISDVKKDTAEIVRRIDLIIAGN